jgi:GTP-binding protein
VKPRAARFVISAADAAGFPPPGQPEIAIAGRSNVGKSSLINALVGQPGLARTSRTPGRTRLLNWFAVDGQPAFQLVDLPGYGYASVARETRAAWLPLIEGYLSARPVLRAVVLLVDARRGPEAEEEDFVAWLAERPVATIVALTKADKLGKSQRPLAAAAARKALGLRRDPVLVSATDGLGLDDLWKAMRAPLTAPPPAPPAPAAPPAAP